MNITIAMTTSRLEPRVEWFLDSLDIQCGSEYDNLKVIIVDFFKEHRPLKAIADRATEKWLLHLSPKPTVWQGPHKLTREDWWAVASARNTALCNAPDGWISFMDDRSVLTPGWFDALQEAIKGNYAVFATYQKVTDLVVKRGLIDSFTENPLGHDARLMHCKLPDAPNPCRGAWCFGNIALPLEWALQVNGYDEDCDGLSFEDVIFGTMLDKHGFDLRFDPRMKVVQDRTTGQLGPVMRREDYGFSPRDKSHAILAAVLHGGRKCAPNYFPPGGIRAMRQRILAGESWPPNQIPENEWFTGRRLNTL